MRAYSEREPPLLRRTSTPQAASRREVRCGRTYAGTQNRSGLAPWAIRERRWGMYRGWWGWMWDSARAQKNIVLEVWYLGKEVRGQGRAGHR